MIEKPHSFSTACNIATQAIAQIASSQYGGQSISLAHLAPFVQVSREKFIEQVKEEFETAGLELDEEQIDQAAGGGKESGPCRKYKCNEFKPICPNYSLW